MYTTENRVRVFSDAAFNCNSYSVRSLSCLSRTTCFGVLGKIRAFLFYHVLGSRDLLYKALIWSANKFALNISTALLESICATSNLHIQSLKLNIYKAGYLFEGYYFGAIIGSAKIEKIKCL